MKLIILSILFLTAFNGRLAQATSEINWNRFFDGDVSGLRDDWTQNVFDHWEGSHKRLHFKKWIHGYAQCEAEVDGVLKSLEDYDKNFRGGDEKSAEAIYAQLLLAFEKTDPAGCRPVMQRALYAGVVNMGPSYDGGQDIFYRNDLVLLTIFLANRDVINPLNPDLREKMAQGKKSLWNQKKNGDYLLSGIYNCQKTQILVSTNLRPFNLAASIAHEIDHLYRDKGGYTFMWDWVQNKDVRAFVISDEILASMYGALYQRNLYLMDKAGGSNLDYTTQGNEFNLFRQGGPLSQLMDYSQLAPPLPFFEFYGVIAQKKDQPWVKKKLCEIDKVIRDGYFTGNGGACNLNGIFPRSTWFNTESYLASLSSLRRDPKEMKGFMAEFESLEEAIKGPSVICSATVGAQNGGKLKDYIGTQLDGDIDHPGNSGVKPCLRVRY